jgi:hypothetical protein
MKRINVLSFIKSCFAMPIITAFVGAIVLKNKSFGYGIFQVSD